MARKPRRDLAARQRSRRGRPTIRPDLDERLLWVDLNRSPTRRQLGALGTFRNCREPRLLRKYLTRSQQLRQPTHPPAPRRPAGLPSVKPHDRRHSAPAGCRMRRARRYRTAAAREWGCAPRSRDIALVVGTWRLEPGASPRPRPASASLQLATVGHVLAPLFSI
jgi:hypothetical protein